MTNGNAITFQNLLKIVAIVDPASKQAREIVEAQRQARAWIAATTRAAA